MRLVIVGTMLLAIIAGCPEKQSNESAREMNSADTSKIVRTDQAKPTLAEVTEISRIALDRQCGSCHHSNRSTNTGALAVYDLNDECWYCKMSHEQMEGLARRTDGSEDFSDEELHAIGKVIETNLGH